jgi:hypothetical protein
VFQTNVHDLVARPRSASGSKTATGKQDCLVAAGFVEAMSGQAEGQTATQLSAGRLTAAIFKRFVSRWE